MKRIIQALGRALLFPIMAPLWVFCWILFDSFEKDFNLIDWVLVRERE